MARTPSARLRSEREEEQSPLFPLQCLLSYPRTRGGPAPINQKDLDMRLRFEARFSALAMARRYLHLYAAISGRQPYQQKAFA